MTNGVDGKPLVPDTVKVVAEALIPPFVVILVIALFAKATGVVGPNIPQGLSTIFPPVPSRITVPNFSLLLDWGKPLINKKPLCTTASWACVERFKSRYVPLCKKGVGVVLCR